MSKALATKNVAAALIGLGFVVAFAFSFATPAKADTLSDLQAQVQALLAQIAALQGGSSTSSTSGGACFTFTKNLMKGSSGSEVMNLQKFLNTHGAIIASTGAGSVGNETMYFGGLTKAAVIKWQNANAASVLAPVGLSAGTGYWGASSRAYANQVCANGSTGTGNTGTGTTNGTGITVTAGTQPANSLAPMNATRVPFTTFTLTNNSGAAVTINGVTVQRTGLANDDAFSGVVLLDSNGVQLGNQQYFNASHQATVGGTFTLNAGQSMTYTVAGNMETTSHSDAGQVASIAVVGVNTSVPVAGSLPISGAQQTINESLQIGTATVGNSGFDPMSHRSESIGTTGLTFSAVRITAQNEDQKLYSITWNQTGSVGSTDLSNLATVINGTSYPVTVDASGKYFTSTIPGGVLISKGNSVDAYIKGDITGNGASNRTIEFDIYRASDIYLVGQTYGYGILPSTSNGGTAYVGSGQNTGSGFQASANPFYYGAYEDVTGGTLSTVSTASTVAPQNIAVNVPNQTLGGFTTNFTGEPVTVQSVKLSVSTSTGATQLQNVTIVDQNGNVVAGPVDSTYVSSGNSTITFNSSITFPTGAMTYTIKGTVKSPATAGANNGSTYSLSTNPKTDWSGAIGQNSGTYLTLTNTTVTMSTMTVQTGALSVSASASPAATMISGNQSNLTIANIVLDASQSGEDVRLSSLPIVVHATDASRAESNLSNCQLYDSSNNVLNNQAVGSSQWTAQTLDGTPISSAGIEANFTFTNSLVIPKGTTVTLALKCSVAGGFNQNDQFAAGVDSHFKPTITGATSGNSLTPTVSTGSTSGIMTIGTASMSVSVPTPLSYSQVAGGSTGVTVGTFTLQPTSGNVSLQHIGLKLNSNLASTSDLVNGVVTIWNGTTQIGTANFSGKSPAADGYYYATSTISGATLAQNVQTALTLKADIAPIGYGMSGKSGHEVRVSLADAQGTSGSASVESGAGATPTTGIAIFASTPTVAKVDLGSGVTDGKLIAFSVTADSKNPVGFGKMVFKISSSTNVTVASPQLYAYTDSSFSQPAGGTNNGVVTATVTYANNTVTIAPSAALEVPAGQTVYLVLKAQSVTYSGANSTWNVTTTLEGDTADKAPNMSTVSSLSSQNFIWSPNSTTTSTLAANDWTNGYGVSGLPSFGFTQSRSN